MKFQRLVLGQLSAATESNGEATPNNATRFLLASGLVVVGLPTFTTTTSTTRMEKAKDTDTANAATPAATNQETTDYPVCGQWCASSSAVAKCIMDPTVIPCRGEWCTTTCQLWDLFVLGPDDKRRPVSCGLYASGIGYPRGAEICQEACLIPEIRKERYPAPTGYGIMCRPNTCSPAATPLPDVGKALGKLQCPCNWFGSECTDEWIPIQRITKGKKYGTIQLVTLQLQPKHWRKVIENYRPGGVIRISHLDCHGVPQEMACALASFDTPGSLEILTSPPDPFLKPEPRQVADRIRSLKSGPVNNLYVNPSISGFFNGNYDYLMDYLQTHPNITRVVILSTGAGLGGALSAVDAIMEENKSDQDDEKKPIQIFLYYGLRNLEHLPFRERLEQLAGSGAIQLTLLMSGGDTNVDACQRENVSLELQAAVERGNASRKLTPVGEMTALMSNTCRPYIQHVVGLDFSSKNGLMKKQGAALENTVFVTIGRLELLRDLPAILKAVSGESNKRVSEHVFTNI